MNRHRLIGILAVIVCAASLAACAPPPGAPPARPTPQATPTQDGMTEMLLMMTTVAIAQGAPMLGVAGLTADLETGDIRLNPPDKTVTTRLGDVTLTITPTLMVNLVHRYGEGTADMLFAIPNLGSFRQAAHFVFTPASGFAGGQTQVIRFNILGALLDADWTSSNAGLDARARLVYEPIGTLALERWMVGTDPTTGQPTMEMVIAGEFYLPDVRLGRVATVEGLTGGLRVGLGGGQSPSWQTAWAGKVYVYDLPGDIDVTANTLRLAISNGQVQVDVRDVDLTMAGEPLFQFAPSSH